MGGNAGKRVLVPLAGGFEELGNRQPDCTEIERLIGWRPRRSVDDAIDDVIACEEAATRLSVAA